MRSIWRDPFNYFMFMRFTSQKHAKAFVEQGEIKFGTPESWVAYAKKPSMRGDRREGALASVSNTERIVFSEVNKIYGGDGAIISVPEGDKILLKNKRHIQLPGFCFYLLKNTLTPDAKEMQQDISGRMFTDFTNDRSEADISRLPEDEKPAVIMIHRHDIFLDRLEKKLTEIGVKEDEIIFDRIKYYDLERGSIEGYVQLTELYCKDNAYSYQEEGRIIINTKDEKIKKKLRKPIHIGSLEDAAHIHNWFLPEGLSAVVRNE